MMRLDDGNRAMAIRDALVMNDEIDRRELLFKALAGLLGGAVGWIPVEIASHGHSLTEQESVWGAIAGIVSVALLAGMIGGMILAVEDNTFEITRPAIRRFLFGFVICVVLALPETYYSNLIFSSILRAGGWGVDHPGSEIYLVAGRLIGWTLMGLMLGIGVGLAGGSVRNALKGGLGGLAGGFVGGAGFDLLGSFSESGLASRLIGFCVIGLAIGFFIGLVHQLTKAAWLAVEAGRLKGRQFRLEGATATLGRAEENSVGLFGDPGVQARHAVIVHQGGTYVIRNLAVQAGTLVNNNRIETTELHDGDHVRISNYELSFHLRADRRLPELAPRATQPANHDQVAPAANRSSAMTTPHMASVSGANAYLRNSEGRQFSLSADVSTRIGRALDNDIVVGDQSVSRHHASIEYSNGNFMLRDLGSQNGTWVGGHRVAEISLSPGDLLRLGDALFTFHV
jgi:pSer/pThr/pTyr-binding forkhead associated (FHA) protein